MVSASRAASPKARPRSRSPRAKPKSKAAAKPRAKAKAAKSPPASPRAPPRSPSPAKHSKLALATHFVLNWSILFGLIPVAMALNCSPPRRGLAAGLVATMVCSILHWTDVRYGGWRHSLDWVVAFVSLGLHLHALTLEAPPWRLRAGWACIGVAVGTYLLGWVVESARTSNALVHGMVVHLVYRFAALWVITLVFCGRFTASETAAFAALVFIAYTGVCYLLWRVAYRRLRVGEP